MGNSLKIAMYVPLYVHMYYILYICIYYGEIIKVLSGTHLSIISILVHGWFKEGPWVLKKISQGDINNIAQWFWCQTISMHESYIFKYWSLVSTSQAAMLEMQQGIDTSPHRNTLSQWYSCIYISNIRIYRILCAIYPLLTLILHIMCTMCYDWCCRCMPALQFCNYLVGIKHNGFGKKALFICKNELIHTILYCAIHCCIMIHKR